MIFLKITGKIDLEFLLKNRFYGNLLVICYLVHEKEHIVNIVKIQDLEGSKEQRANTTIIIIV